MPIIAMNRIDAIFDALRREQRKALMPFLCAGYPTPDATGPALRAIDDAGASVIEIGFPFSDPIADGPVIAAAMHQALGQGVTPARILRDVAAVRARVRAGLVAMVSVSIVHRIGAGAFARDLAAAGFDGVILPDAPLEEAAMLAEPFRAAGLTTTLLIAPTTPADRAGAIARACTGFVYLLSRVGLTGDAGAGPDIASLRERIVSIRRASELPIACGFGISTPEQVGAVVAEGGADAAIVGSALVRAMGDAHQRRADPAGAAGALCAALAAGSASITA